MQVVEGEIKMCVCQWEGDKVVSMCGAHSEAARREYFRECDRMTKLEECLKELMGLIQGNELVRNPATDHQPDWWKRMVYFVGVLKKAQELVS